MKVTLTGQIEIDPRARCYCPGCGWDGSAIELHNFQGVELEPEEPTPAGQCPKCQGKAHVVPEAFAKMPRSQIRKAARTLPGLRYIDGD